MDYPNSSNQPERLPESLPAQDFPVSDISSYRSETALAYLSLLSGCSYNRKSKKIAHLARHEAGKKWVCFGDRGQNNDSIKRLSESWANTVKTKRNDPFLRWTAFQGMFATIGFLRKTDLIDANFGDYNEELETMRSYGQIAIEAFADNAWGNMFRDYPLVYRRMSAFRAELGDVLFENYLSKKGEDPGNPEFVLLDASIALPYVMSVTTRMEKSLNASWKQDKDNYYFRKMPG